MTIYHIGAHDADNAGDIVLLDAMTRLIEKHLGWDIMQIDDWREDKRHETYNRADAVIVGGGGLFIRDTKPNSKSGWRWNISIDELNKIASPLIIFGVGLNRFRGQEDYDPIFYEHMNALANKAAFFGVRERSSIPEMERYTGGGNIQWQPCPASMCGIIYEDIDKLIPDPKTVVFAPAMDRYHLRGDVSRIMPALHELVNRGYKLKVAFHIKSDLNAIPYLEEIDCTMHDLRGQDADKILRFYKQAGLVIGMRMHSLLIPFGFGRPVIPIISHDKIKRWLEDIGHPEWGIELKDQQMTAKIMERVGKDQADELAVDLMHAVTLRNLHYIKEIIDG